MFRLTAGAIALATLAFSNLAPTPAQANDYPWCVQYPDSTIGGTNCGFVTLAQCMASATGAAGRCYENPLYVAAAPSSKRQRVQRN